MDNGSQKDDPVGASGGPDGRGPGAWNRARRSSRSLSRSAGYVATVIANIVILYIVNNLLNWGAPFLTSDFVAPLAVINLSLLASIVGNSLLFFYDPGWLRHLVRATMNAFSFAATYSLLMFFPFEFGFEAGELVARILLILGLVGTAIGIVVEVVQLLLGRD